MRDSIDTTGVGLGEHVPMSSCQVVGAQPGDSYAKITQIHTITGGTGRFAGAQGSFLMERVADPQRFITFGSFHGSITPPVAAH